MKQYPNVTLKILIKHKDKILILKHRNGIFDFPGGRIKWKESISGAIKRELKEELDYSLNKEPELFHVWNYISKDGKRHSVMIYFICQLDKKPKFSSPEKLQALWLSKKQMASIIDDQKFLDKMYQWKSS